MDELLNRYLQGTMQSVYWCLLKMGAQKEDAEDIVQETVFQFVQYFESLPGDYLDAWLFRVAINKYYDQLRRQKYREQYINYWNLEDLIDLETPEKAVLQNEDKTLLWKVLQRLSPKEAELLILKYSAEFSLKDIAIIYQTTDKTIKTQLTRTKKKMKKYLKEDEHFGERFNF